MAANRKRLAIWAPEDRWKLLGELLLERRRVTLGHQFRTTFARARLPLTPDGNPNTRRVDDLESNRRANRWPPGTLKEMAAAYQVTYESMLAVLSGESDTLVPAGPALAPPAALPVPGEPPGWIASEEGRTAADRPYADRIRGRVDLLRMQGVADPSGAQLFGEGTPDARDWDKYAADWDIGDRIWFIADIQRRAAGRLPPNSGEGAGA